MSSDSCPILLAIALKYFLCKESEIFVRMILLYLFPGNVLETALRKIGRDDIVQQCIFNTDEVDRAVAKVQFDQSGFESLKEELGPSRDASLRRDASLDITYDEQDIMKVRPQGIPHIFGPD
jgi:hypothetical protein